MIPEHLEIFLVMPRLHYFATCVFIVFCKNAKDIIGIFSFHKQHFASDASTAPFLLNTSMIWWYLRDAF